jgi:site-specific DNA-methyltransferase (adenine-specific)
MGDCLELMKDIPDGSVDMVLTDPPYELDTHGGTANKNLKRDLHDNHIKHISNGFNMDGVFAEMIRVCKTPNLLIFCSNKQISKTMGYFEKLKLSTTLLIWQKTNPIPFANGKYQEECEFIIYVRGKNAPFNPNIDISGKKKIITCKTVKSKGRLHPTQKPVDVLNPLIELHSLPEQIILDPFMGSGTTGVACKNLNRNFIGFELDPDYFKAALGRITFETT